MERGHECQQVSDLGSTCGGWQLGSRQARGGGTATRVVVACPLNAAASAHRQTGCWTGPQTSGLAPPQRTWGWGLQADEVEGLPGARQPRRVYRCAPAAAHPGRAACCSSGAIAKRSAPTLAPQPARTAEALAVGRARIAQAADRVEDAQRRRGRDDVGQDPVDAGERQVHLLERAVLCSGQVGAGQGKAGGVFMSCHATSALSLARHRAAEQAVVSAPFCRHLLLPFARPSKSSQPRARSCSSRARAR